MISLRLSGGASGLVSGWRMLQVGLLLLCMMVSSSTGQDYRTHFKPYNGGRTYYNPSAANANADFNGANTHFNGANAHFNDANDMVADTNSDQATNAAGGKGNPNQKTTFLVPRSDKIQIAFTDGGREIQQSLHTDLLKLYKSVMEQLLERDQFIQTMKTLMDKIVLLDNLAERVRRLELKHAGRPVEIEVGRGANPPGQDNSVIHSGDNRGGGGGRGGGDDRNDNIAKKVRRHQEDINKMQEEQQRLNKLIADGQLDLQRHRDFTGKMQQNIGKMELEISRNKQMTIAQAELLDHHANKMETQRSTSEVIDAKVATQASKIQWHDFRLGMIENVTSRLDSDYISMQLSFGEFHTTQRKIYGLVEKLQTDTERCHVNVATAKMKVRFLEQDVDKLLTIVEKLTPANVSYHGPSPSSGGSAGGGRTRLEGGFARNTSTISLAGSARIQVQEMIDRSIGPLNYDIAHLNATTRQLERENNRQQKQIDKASVDIETMGEDARGYNREVRAVGSRVDSVRNDVEELEAETERLKRKVNKVEKEVREHSHPGHHRWTPTSSPLDPIESYTDTDMHAHTTVGHQRRTTRSLDDVTPVVRGETRVTPSPGWIPGMTESAFTGKSLTTESVIKVTTKPSSENDAEKGTTHHGRNGKPSSETGPSQTPTSTKNPNCTVTGFGPAKLVRIFPRIFTGAWMKDPTRPADRRIYVIRNSQKVSNVREYANETMLSANVATHVHHMPHKCTGTGHVVYDGHVYCNRYQSNRIVKYDLKTGKSRSEKLRNAGHNNTYSYSSGAYSDIDLAIDEDGLWAIYATRADEGLITVSRLDPVDMTVQGTWVTDFNKTEAVNAFMVCGRLYAIGHRLGEPLTVAYAYDTRVGAEIPLRPGQVSFRERNPDKPMSMDYNPSDRRIYAWNLSPSFDALLVAYDVRFLGHS